MAHRRRRTLLQTAGYGDYGRRLSHQLPDVWRALQIAGAGSGVFKGKPSEFAVGQEVCGARLRPTDPQISQPPCSLQRR